MSDSRNNTDRTQWRVSVGEEETSAVFEPAINSPDAPVFVCAHGAGGNMDDRSMVKLARVLCERGSSVVRFNFLYRERKSGRPDQMPRLEKCFSAVVERVRT